jgi:hypothetical protein
MSTVTPNEVVRFSRESDPVLSFNSHDDPFLHQPAVTARVKAGLPLAHQFIDSRLRALCGR